MDPNQAVTSAQQKFTQAVEHFQTELKKLRTGRASAGMLDGLMVEAYGVAMPLNQVAGVSAPEPQLIQISPFDPSNIQAISTAIRNNHTLGMNPSDDGRIIRVPVPPLTEERRRDIVKIVGQKQEECLINLRGVRREAMESVDKAKKAKDIGEDDAKRLESQIEDSIKSATASVQAAAKAREADIMSL